MQMIRSSGVIAGVLAVDMAALLMYNVAGMMVTGHLGAVFRCAARAACAARVGRYLHFGTVQLCTPLSCWQLWGRAGRCRALPRSPSHAH